MKSSISHDIFLLKSIIYAGCTLQSKMFLDESGELLAIFIVKLRN